MVSPLPLPVAFLARCWHSSVTVLPITFSRPGCCRAVLPPGLLVCVVSGACSTTAWRGFWWVTRRWWQAKWAVPSTSPWGPGFLIETGSWAWWSMSSSLSGRKYKVIQLILVSSSCLTSNIPSEMGLLWFHLKHVLHLQQWFLGLF